MERIISIASRHLAGVLAAKVMYAGLKAAKLRHLAVMGLGAYALHKAFGPTQE